MREQNLKIQDELPIRTIGIETERENLDFQHRPPHRYAHVWFAPRPTPASRLAILASVLPDSVEEDQLLKWMGFQPNNKPRDKSISEHVRDKRETKDQRDGAEHEHYGYRKIWRYSPEQSVKEEMRDVVENTWDRSPMVLDATAGGGTIPLESVRYNLDTIANELNPVPSVMLEAILNHTRTEKDLQDDIVKWGKEIKKRARQDLKPYFPEKSSEKTQSYLFAHRISCPDCGLEVPLASNWWLARGRGSNEGIAAYPEVNNDTNTVDFRIVDFSNSNAPDFNPTNGTISYSKMTCPRCDVTVDSDHLKQELRDGNYDYQLYAIFYDTYESGGAKFRTPREEDIEAFNKATQAVESDIDLATLLNFGIPEGEKTRELHNVGISEWRDFFTPRQLLTHYTFLQKYHEVKEEIISEYTEDEATAILTYLTLVADKGLNYNSRLSIWDPSQPKMGNMYGTSDYSFSWAFQEHNFVVEDHGYNWMLDNIANRVYEGVREGIEGSTSDVEVYQGDAADLPLSDGEVDAIVLDPPYYGMIMYAELSDYFYVWMRKYLQDEYPEFFEKELTEKTDEAVANPSQFSGVSESKSKSELAKLHYEQKMTTIFDELYRVLSEDGTFTMMFTHKETEAWDTLTSALIESGFIVTSTHPINTENQYRVQQAGKNSADSTILLNSQKREENDRSPTLWEEVKDETRRVARERVARFEEQDAEFTKIDMMLASFGPTLEIFTKNYPVVDDQGDPVSPQTALDEARVAVRDHMIEKYLNEGVKGIDGKSEWYILAWLIFEAKRFPYDEGRQLGVSVGENVDELKKDHRMWRTRSGDILLRPHDERVQDVNKEPDNRSNRKPVNPDSISFAMALDEVHAAMHVYDSQGATEAWNWLNDRNCGSNPGFKATLEALLRVLPQEHEDWKIARDLAAGETGELLNLDLDAGIFQDEDDDEYQGNLNDF